MKQIVIGLLSTVILFSSCSTNHNVVSAFGKRRYTKGFYCFSAPSHVKSVGSIAHKPAEEIAKVDKMQVANDVAAQKPVATEPTKVIKNKAPLINNLIRVMAKTMVNSDIHTNYAVKLFSPPEAPTGNVGDDDDSNTPYIIAGSIWTVLGIIGAILFGIAAKTSEGVIPFPGEIFAMCLVGIVIGITTLMQVIGKKQGVNADGTTQGSGNDDSNTPYIIAGTFWTLLGTIGAIIFGLALKSSAGVIPFPAEIFAVCLISIFIGLNTLIKMLGKKQGGGQDGTAPQISGDDDDKTPYIVAGTIWTLLGTIGAIIFGLALKSSAGVIPFPIEIFGVCLIGILIGIGTLLKILSKNQDKK